MLDECISSNLISPFIFTFLMWLLENIRLHVSLTLYVCWTVLVVRLALVANWWETEKRNPGLLFSSLRHKKDNLFSSLPFCLVSLFLLAECFLNLKKLKNVTGRAIVFSSETYETDKVLSYKQYEQHSEQKKLFVSRMLPKTL